MNKNDEIKAIYDALQDEESRFIFGRRILYSLTQDETYIRDIVNRIPEVRWLKAEIMRSHENFVFGAGGYGKVVRQLAPSYWKGILDNDNRKWGGTAMVCQFFRQIRSFSIQMRACFSPSGALERNII